MTQIPFSKFLTTVCGVSALLAAPAFAQKNVAGAAEIKESLGKLKSVGSVLMIAAHPDDENTAVLAYFAKGRKLETGYLSLTRGEGGQNYIGAEQGYGLGLIRTEELLAARRIDGAHQFFSRAIDFGFTKTAQETMQKWGKERILGDIVWTIRKFRPDVIILRFSGTPRDGHGQHQTSAILGREAFSAAGDPTKYPEQLKDVEPWQAKRLMWNAFSFTPEQEKEAAAMGGRVAIDSGDYNPVLGFSYGEIAGMSRSMHRSQAMGSPERKGSSKQFFITIAGDTAKGDPLDGVDTTWKRVAGGAPVQALVDEADRAFEPEHPEKSLPALVKARAMVAWLKDPWAVRELAEFDETIALCAGVAVDANAERASASPGAKLGLTVTAIQRGAASVRFDGVEWGGTAAAKPEAIAGGVDLAANTPLSKNTTWSVAAGQSYTQPYWLVEPHTADTYTIPDPKLLGMPENPALLTARVGLTVDGARIVLERAVANHYVDRARGELVRPLTIVPPVSVEMPETALVFANGASKHIEVAVRSQTGAASGTLKLTIPDGWRVEPQSAGFKLAAGEQTVLSFSVTPPGAKDLTTVIRAAATVDGREIANDVDVIAYDHIPPQTLFPPSTTKAVSAVVKNLAAKVGYIAGAGDEVPQSLRQIGCDITMLSADDLARADLSRFDAIVTGVRAYNVRPDLKANRQRLLEYVEKGGTMVVQYNVVEGGFGGGDPRALDEIGPYSMRFTRDRVTVEDVPVKFPDPSNPLLKSPNQITDADFVGWVQERGLYFPGSWDSHYSPLFECHDPGEKELAGGTLATRYGKGAYVFTAYSWFRQLPAGVPGAYRIFANFLSAGKVLNGAR